MKYTKREVNILDHATEVLKALRSGGLLVNTKHDGFVNTMTVSWGQIGYEWEKPMMTVFIRKHRCTHDQLEAHGEFTVSVPMGNFDRKILGIAGTKSGHDVDKIKELGLTPVDSNHVDVPGFAELPLTIECKVKYVQDQDPKAVANEFQADMYPQDVDGSFHGANRDYHTVYMGEIVGAYVIESEA